MIADGVKRRLSRICMSEYLLAISIIEYRVTVLSALRLGTDAAMARDSLSVYRIADEVGPSARIL